uniref:Uncharacterized protein n=1 Tax=Panagrolaimus davidi TaxID=227884 RepID=A0A914PY49_9BILA
MSYKGISLASVAKACDEYKELYKLLLDNLSKQYDDRYQKKLINEFSDKYLCLYLWKTCLNPSSMYILSPEDMKKAAFHFEFGREHCETVNNFL